MLSLIHKFAGVFLLAGLLTIDLPLPQPSLAQPSRKFRCEVVGEVPTTVVQTVRGSIPMIQWVNSFTGRYNSVGNRCQEVSTRLDRFNRDSKLKFIRTGNVNRYPVLCVDTGVSGNTCPQTSVLVTLPKGTDSALMLEQMLDLRARASGRIIQLSGAQLIKYRNGDAYVNIDRLLLTK
ncbi:COP23 domain-containing protein [Chamaesiphon sp.]|uniref:COP23 domain-containing protein n=1 Tax=Chamaesiphon sp. TaxID=2814140 RepID=UPI0035944B68